LTIEWGDKKKRWIAKDKTFYAPLLWNKKPWVCEECGEICQPIFSASRDHVCPACGTMNDFHARRVFALSLGDWLDQNVDLETFCRFLEIVYSCKNLRFLLLTKRPQNFFNHLGNVINGSTFVPDLEFEKTEAWLDGHPPPNVWVGTSVENNEQEDRMQDLLKIPAAKRFLSVEPLLEDTDIQAAFGHNHGCSGGFAHPDCEECGWLARKVDWVIVGGESGRNARPCNLDWIRNIVRQCQQASVPCFVKQVGSNPVPFSSHPDLASLTRFMHPKGGDINEWPEDLRIQEVPA